MRIFMLRNKFKKKNLNFTKNDKVAIVYDRQN
jgi:hypothetical protein